MLFCAGYVVDDDVTVNRSGLQSANVMHTPLHIGHQPKGQGKRCVWVLIRRPVRKKGSW